MTDTSAVEQVLVMLMSPMTISGVNRWMNGKRDGWMDGYKLDDNRWMDRWVDGWID